MPVERCFRRCTHPPQNFVGLLSLEFVLNASNLLAIANGKTCEGDRRCFYCGNPASDIVLDLRSSFNDWWNVACPTSDRICVGCSISLEEKIEVPGRDKPQKTRNWSWLVTAKQAAPLGDIASIRAACIAPPSEAWAMAIAVSGQKHVLFRTPANVGDEPFAVQLETQTVLYGLDDLRERLALAKRIAAASGKPALTVKLDTNLAMRVLETCTEQQLNDWFDHAAEPINQLAAHLCPSKEECQREFSSDS